MSRGTLGLNDCTVIANQAVFGGGIYDAGDAATLINSTVSGNTASLGGGICTVSNILTLIDCNVNDNMGGGVESGVHGELTMMIITNCTICGNAMAFRGGGIANSGILILDGSNVSGNTADRGGGIVNFRMVTMTNNTVSGNTAAGGYGGGILNSVAAAHWV